MVSSPNRNRHERLKGCFKFTPLAACRPSLTQSQGGSQKSDPICWNRATSISRETIRPVVKLLLASSARAGVWGWWSGGCASVRGGGGQMALPVTSETWKCGPNCWQTAIGRILPPARTGFADPTWKTAPDRAPVARGLLLNKQGRRTCME